MELTITLLDHHRGRLEGDDMVATAEADTTTTVATTVIGQAISHHKADQTEDRQVTTVVVVDEDLLVQDKADNNSSSQRDVGCHHLLGHQQVRYGFDSGCGNFPCGGR